MHLLVALDGSSHGDTVAGVALQLAQAIPNATVTALHVVNVKVASGNLLQDIPGHLGFEPAIVSAEIEAEHLRDAQAIVGAFASRAEALGVKVQQVVRAGAIPQVITDAASAADLLIMGARGETEDRFPGQGGRLVGNLPMRNTPILVVPKGIDHIDAVSLGYDGSTAAGHAARAVRAVFVAAQIPVHGIFVCGEGGGGTTLDELDQRLGVAATHHVVTGSPHDAIVATAVSSGSQVVALGFSGHSKVKDFLFGTLGDRILAEGKLAVLLAY